MPEKGHLLFQRALGVDHAVYPARVPRLYGIGVVQLEPVAGNDVVRHLREALRVEQILDDLLVTLGGARFEFVAVRAESGASHQMG